MLDLCVSTLQRCKAGAEQGPHSSASPVPCLVPFRSERRRLRAVRVLGGQHGGAAPLAVGHASTHAQPAPTTAR